MAFQLDSIDNEAKSQGIWDDHEGSRFLIASTSAHAFQEYFSKIQRPYKRAMEKGTMEGKTSNELLCKALAKYVLLDWEDVESNGVAVPYSESAAKEALIQNDLLREHITEISMDIVNYKTQKEEDEVKN